MARLPAPEDYALSTPSPSRSITDISPVRENPDLLTGKVMQDIGAMIEQKTAEYDDLAAQTALNKLQEKKLQLTLGDQGYHKLQGDQVLQQDVLGNYSAQLKQETEALTAGLNTARAKARFQEGAAQTLLQLRTGILTHVTSEAEKALDAGAIASIKAAAESAALQANDPKAVADAVDKAQAVFEKIAARKGYTGDQLVQYRRETVGAVHSAVVAGMLQTDTADAAANALAYMAAHKDEMTTEKVMQFGGLIRAAVLKHDAIATADSVAAAAAPRVPSDMERVANLAGPVDLGKLTSAVAKAESGNRDFNPDGSIVTSPKGARAAMQVMPATAAAPGLGITPARDNSPAESNRVGREYLAALVRRYDGDLPKALAAYNWGMGNVDKAVEASRAVGFGGKTIPATDWLKQAPAETQAYVATVLKGYTSGATGAQQPTLQDAKAEVERRMAGRPQEAIDMATTRLAARWGDAKAAQAQREEETLIDLRRRIDDGRVTDFAQVTPGERALLQDKAHVVKSYIETEGRKADKNLELSVEGTGLFFALREDPVRLKNSSVADIMKLAPEIGRARMLALEEERDKLIRQPEHEKQALIDADQFRNLMNKAQLDTKTDEGKKRFVDIKDRAESYIIAEQNRTGKSLSRADKEKFIATALTEVPVRTKSWWGWTGTDTKRVIDVQYRENIIVPPDFKAAMLRKAAQAGDQEPTAEDLRRMYIGTLTTAQKLR